MNRSLIFDFLQDLVQNNSKEWMDKHRHRYESCKEVLIDTFEPILDELKRIDPRIVQPNARKCLNRINNNLMFHPERPTYKDHFGVGFGYGKGLADFYIHLGINEMFIAGGLWHPSSDKLKKLRQEIDYEGKEIKEILNEPHFKRHFELYQEDKLVNAPKGYSADHPNIDLLKLKSLAAFRPIEREDLLNDKFSALVIDSYRTILPLLDFTNRAIAD